MNNQEVDKTVNLVRKVCKDKPSRGRQYMEWLDTKPKTFLSFREWMFTYHEGEEI